MAATRVKLRVSPGAARSVVVGRHGTDLTRTVWKLRVSAPPTDGRANDATVRLLADTLHLPTRDVEIVAGHSARDKVATVRGIDHDEIDRRLARAVAPLPSMLGKDAT